MAWCLERQQRTEEKWFKGSTVLNSYKETTSCKYITTVTASLKHSK